VASDSVLVTHPFHPLAGQRLEVLGRARRGGAEFLRCAGGALGTVTVPVGWTERVERPAGTRLTYEVLVEFAAMVGAIRDMPVKVVDQPTGEIHSLVSRWLTRDLWI
jgi:hypothetical protein